MSMIGLDLNLQLLEQILGKLDIALSQLRDDLRGIDGRTLTDLYNIESGIKAQTDKLTFDASNYLYVHIGDTDVSLGGGPAQLQVKDPAGVWTDVGYASGNLNVPISIQADNIGLATESTLGAIKAQTDKLTYDANSYLYINIGADSIGLATESTLSGFSGKFPGAVSLSDALSNPTTTLVGSAMLGWDGSYWRRVAVDTNSRIRSVVESLPSLPSGTNIIGGVFADHDIGVSIDQQVGTTEVVGSAVDVRRRGRKIVYMKNTQDVDVTITIEGSYDGTDWYTVRSGITVAAGSSKIGVLNDAYGYIRARAVASASPSSGTVKVVIESLT